MNQGRLKRVKKSIQELEKEDLKSYNIEVLWQQSWELGILFTTNS